MRASRVVALSPRILAALFHRSLSILFGESTLQDVRPFDIFQVGGVGTAAEDPFFFLVKPFAIYSSVVPGSGSWPVRSDFPVRGYFRQS